MDDISPDLVARIASRIYNEAPQPNGHGAPEIAAPEMPAPPSSPVAIPPHLGSLPFSLSSVPHGTELPGASRITSMASAPGTPPLPSINAPANTGFSLPVLHLHHRELVYPARPLPTPHPDSALLSPKFGNLICQVKHRNRNFSNIPGPNVQAIPTQFRQPAPRPLDVPPPFAKIFQFSDKKFTANRLPGSTMPPRLKNRKV